MAPARTPRSVGRFATQAAALGATGFAAVLFAAPGAHADTLPSGDATTGPATPGPETTGPATTGPATTGPATPGPATTGPATPDATDAPTPAATPAQTPTYGLQKVRVGVQLKQGDFAPPGYSLANAKIQIAVTEQDGTVDDPATCLTDATGYCPEGTLAPGASAVVTQLTAPDGPGLLVDPTPQDIPPCTVPATATFPFNFCGEEPATPTTVAAIKRGLDSTAKSRITTMVKQAGPAALPDVTTSSCDPSTEFCQTVRVFNDPGIPPHAVDDTATTTIGEPVTVNVLANDNAEGGGTMTVSAVGTPRHGTAKISGSKVVYTPATGFFGSDSFTYTVTTANGSATADVTVTVTAPPLAVDDTAATKSGQPVTIAVLANDDARGGGTMTISDVGAPGHGTARISGSDIVYTPAAGFSGTDSFTYTVSTDHGSDTATVTVTVTAPVATASLSDTGVASQQLLLGGGGLLGSGALLLLGGRRRRRPA